ncbi:hypothetical protein, partial [Sinorhizobium meliloti]|uniref:hypothetical protein n=1 Tax=Rhizobium meliloti TaxID=382 RepID=UPI001AECE710
MISLAAAEALPGKMRSGFPSGSALFKNSALPGKVGKVSPSGSCSWACLADLGENWEGLLEPDRDG